MRWLERYLVEGTSPLKHFARLERVNRTKTRLERSLSTTFDTCEVSTGVVLKIVALFLGVPETVFLIGLGASIPADDWFWGDLGQWLVCAGIVLGSLLFIAWLFPRLGGIVLVIVGGLAAISGLTLTIQAGLVFGAAPLVSGLLFVGAASRSAVADELVRGDGGTSATLRADRPR